MSTSKKTEHSDRSQGGPGSSQQDAKQPSSKTHSGTKPGQPTNSRQSRVSGGGGERDSHHTHDPETKS